MKTLLLSVCTVLLAAAPGRAGVLITFDFPAQSGNLGETLTYTGVIQNLDLLNPAFLNTYDLNIAGADFAADGLLQFLFNVPISLAAGASTDHIELFTITLTSELTQPAGVYF